MTNTLTHMEEILSRQVSGFHQYALEPCAHLQYVSRNLCRMLDVTPDELLDESADLYALYVHPDDRKIYSDFLADLREAEKTAVCEYRLIRKDGSTLFVRDSAVSERTEQGIFTACSVLTDITDLKNEHTDLQFLNDTIPCGFLRYTCEKQPRVTYIHPNMARLLRFPPPRDGELDYTQMYMSNIFLMIPMEERRRFSKYLNRVYSGETPIAGEMTLLRCDGTRARVFGWVSKHTNSRGEEEFQSVCMDITDRYQARKSTENRRYLRALSDVYSKIFEFNLDANTVKCLHCNDASSFKKFENLAMQIDDAVENWVLQSVVPRHQSAVRSFFHNFCQKQLYDPEERPSQISYQARSSQGDIREYLGIFIKIDEAVSFYCCREVQDMTDTQALKMENDQLKEGMRNLVMQFSDGLAAFEISPEGLVKPLYASENVCEFFGYTKEEWLPLTERFTPLESFVAYSEASFEEYEELLRTGEAEFTYFDYKSETERRIRAICSRKEPGGHSTRYIMLYAVESGTSRDKPALPENRSVSIRTFGYFDVFVGDKPIAFRNKKSKELFALLVDRRGGYVTSDEAIGFLWEDEPANTVTLSRYRKVALRLKSTLEEYGIPDVLESVDGKRRIVMEKVQCDLYDYLSGREECAQLFKGSYLTNYSWGETTLAQLSGPPQSMG